MRTTNHRSVACSYVLAWMTAITTAPTTAAPPLSAGEPRVAGGGVAQPIESAGEIVDTILDSSADSPRRYKAFDALLRSVEPQERYRSLCQILEHPDQEFRVLAAGALLQEPKLDPETVSRISKAARGLTSREWLVLMGHLVAVVDALEVRSVAKTVLINALDQIDRGAKQTDTELHAAAGRAFQFVCANGEPCPRGLVARMLRTLPRSRELWLTLACRGGVQEKDVPLAASIYQDDELSLRTRHAAASAIGSLRPAAREYLRESLESYFLEMASYPLLDDLPHMYELDDAGRRLHVFLDRLHVLEVLMCVDGPMAHEMVFTQIDRQNEIVRGVLVVFAAARWPEQLLELAESRDVPEVDDRMLALIVERRPQLKKRCLAMGDAQRIEHFLTQFRKFHWSVGFPQVERLVPAG